MKVLVAYDGSPLSESVLSEIIKRPWPEGTEVKVVQVVERPLGEEPRSGGDSYAPLVEFVRCSYRSEAQKAVQIAVARLACGSGLKCSGEVRDGSAKEGILHAIGEWDPDLVVVGGAGHSSVRRPFLGSVAAALVTLAPCPVEVVRTAAVA